MVLTDIKPYPKNAKQHPKKQVGQIAASIKEFGFNQPIVVDKNNVIIVGHGRYEAAKLLGLTDVPVVQVDLTEEQAKAYRLADNKLNESEWDMNLVIEELKELSQPMLDLTGFDSDLIIEPDEKDDQVPDVPETPKSKLGDIYQLGAHRVMCGDSTKAEDVEKLMDGKKADMVFTDPPYALFGNSTGVAGITDDKMTRPFFLEIFKAMKRTTKLFAHLYTCCDWHSAFSLQNMAREVELKEKNLCIWDKGDRGIGGAYQNCYEMIWFHANSPVAKTTVGVKRAGERPVNGRPNIWRYKRAENTLHNAAKPVEMIAWAIENSSDDEMIVLDLFLGSGSTLIAAEKTGRICYGIEIDPRYVDVIIKRWEDYTGNKAIKLND